MEEVNPAFLEFPRDYAGTFLTPRALGEFARDREAGVSEEFLQYARMPRLMNASTCVGRISSARRTRLRAESDSPSP
jgi:hypothetical protein